MLDFYGSTPAEEIFEALEYAIVADAADNKVVLKQGSIEVVEVHKWIGESKVICERVTQRTDANKVEIK